MIEPAKPESFRAMNNLNIVASGALTLVGFDPAMDVVARRMVSLAKLSLNVLSQPESTHSQAVLVS